MKHYLLIACLISYGFFSFAQNGLEKIIVERYYISDANDTAANSFAGVLPIGSVTYRIYADMQPKYTIVHEGKFLKNNNKEAGVPVKMRDGLIVGTPQLVKGFTNSRN